jgi:hypothetical protein
MSSQSLPSTSITLGRDELLALLQTLGVNTMNGLPDEPFKGVNEREAVERLNAGAQTLINRGLVTEKKDGTLVIDSALLALVGACVASQATSLLAIRDSEGEPIARYFSATSHILVAQYSPRAGVFQFDYLPDAAALNAAIEREIVQIGFGAHMASAISFQVSDEALKRIIEEAQAGKSAHAQTDTQRVCKDEKTAQSFVAALAHGSVLTGITAWGLRGGQSQGTDSLIVIVAPEGNWLLQPIHATSNLLVQPASQSDCIQACVKMVEPLIKARFLQTG